MKAFGILAAAAVIAAGASPVLADRVVHKTVVVQHHAGPSMHHRKQICRFRTDHRGHRIRRCTWG